MISAQVNSKNKLLQLDLLVKEDGLYNVEITKIKSGDRLRSLQQNKYYWGIVLPALSEFFASTGKTLNYDQAHLQFKDMVGWFEEVTAIDVSASNNTGSIIYKQIRHYRSFSNAGTISKIEFMDAVALVKVAIEEFSGGEYTIPEPHDNF